MNHVTHPLSSNDTSIFSFWKSANLLYQEIQIQIVFGYKFLFFFTFFDSKDCFNKHGYNFDDVTKMTTLSLLKIKVF